MDSHFTIFKDSPYATGPRPVCPVSNVGVLWPNGGWIKMPLGTEVGLGPGDIVLDGDAGSPTKMGTAAPPTFRPVSIVAKRSPISATAVLLF